ncbi:hypothetical protein [Sphingomonas yabuuchiae]|uniref:hypothetical protein n=1 Tax=Sphingomonas yabuuchiae TaxID=172044 RepID=UPI003613DE79
MSDVSQTAALAAILDALTLMQDQVEEIGERSKRLEANQADILARLETIDAAQAIATDLQPNLEHLASEVSETRGEMGEGFARVAQVAGWAHAAAAGNAAPLPADVLDDPLLELFVISQPADRTSTRRAIVDWREKARTVDTAALTALLISQYRPSPTDDRAGRRLRYKLAAITRDELERRGAVMPPLPRSTIAADRSAEAQRAVRGAGRGVASGEGAMLYAEPELAGAMDIMAAARREGVALPEQSLASGLAALHQTISDRLSVGDRPELASDPKNVGAREEILRDR